MVMQICYPTAGVGGHQALNADIVAVHGLNGDPKRTWTDRKTNVFWLKDLLPTDLPNIRIMTFGYNADAAFGNTTADIIDHAKTLLSSLVDKREEDDEIARPIIFIGHSLGGIIIKQALFQAKIEARYQSINECTKAILFLGTPHRGSEKASYGKILAKLATTVMHKPPARLVRALEQNSESLMRLTTDFRFQLPNYQIFSFYEMKPIRPLSSLVVEKYSALLDIDGEEQIPVDANHHEMCKFPDGDNEVYEKVFKRIRRIIKTIETSALISATKTSGAKATSYNKHYCVPYNLSSIFTGREDLIKKLRATCLPQQSEDRSSDQRRFVLYGLGGSGKTQTCLKFAQDYRERFWGIFWVNASSYVTAEQGFFEIADICKINKDVKTVRRWLANTEEPWLLVLDNADDPSLDIWKFFPPGNRGIVLVTTRNPDYKIHSTVGSYELGSMDIDDALTLFLRAVGVEDISSEATRMDAVPVVELLGCLALAITQAGAYVRKGLCKVDEYCEHFTQHRKRLLEDQLDQANSEYNYNVYTTWEISIEEIRRQGGETAENAMQLIKILCCLHYDGILEGVFQNAWENMHIRTTLAKNISKLFYVRCQEGLEEWDSMAVREAAVLLESFSLLKIDRVNHRMSMHPLVHAWAKDRLSEHAQERYWLAASSTLAAAISWEYQLSDYTLRRSLVSHIDWCISTRKGNGTFIDHASGLDFVEMAAGFALVYAENGRLQSAVSLEEMVVRARREQLGDKHADTLSAMNNLANSYSDLGRVEEAMDLWEEVADIRQKTLGGEHHDTLLVLNNIAQGYSDLGNWQEAVKLREFVLDASDRTLPENDPNIVLAMDSLANSYSDLGHQQEAAGLREKIVDIRQETNGLEHPDTLMAIGNLADSYSDLGYRKEALELRDTVVDAYKRMLGDEHPDTLRAISNLAISYNDDGRFQEALELKERMLNACQRTLGIEHPDTLTAMHNLANSYSDIGQEQKAVELREKVLEARQRRLGEAHPDTLLAITNLGASYNQLGRKQEALELKKKALDTTRVILGNEHPDTLMVMNNLAVSYNEFGQTKEAIELWETVREVSTRTLGEKHPDTLLAMENLAISSGSVKAGHNDSESGGISKSNTPRREKPSQRRHKASTKVKQREPESSNVVKRWVKDWAKGL